VRYGVTKLGTSHPGLQRMKLELLSKVIGRELELIDTEVAVGPYSADILAKAAGQDDYKVIIENQLGKTDHDHLGKMITYAAGLGAKTLIWVSDRFCEEHRAALIGLIRILAKSWILRTGDTRLSHR